MFPRLDGALPILGHLPEMYRRFPELCARGEAAHGPLFWIQGGPGAEQLMCTDPGALDLLRHPAASTSFYAEGFGELLAGSLFAFDGAEHRRIRGAMAPAFTPAGLGRTDVLSIIDDAARRHIERWVVLRRVGVLDAARELALEIIFRVLGVAGQDVAAWRKQFARYLLTGVPSRSTVLCPLVWLGGQARRWLDERLGAMVRARRSSGDESTLVGAVANRRDEDGALLDEALVVANLRLLVLAGHETTASAIAWNLLELAGSARDQQRAKDEVAGLADPIALAADPTRFTFAEAQFREALRLYPAVHSVIRRITAELELAGRTIARGTLLNVPLVYLLRAPSRFTDPEKYDPDRWTQRPRPGSIDTAMFGGGPHFCLGYHLAIAEGTLFNLRLADALRRRHLRLRRVRPGPLPPPIYLPLSHPPRGLSIELER